MYNHNLNQTALPKRPKENTLTIRRSIAYKANSWQIHIVLTDDGGGRPVIFIMEEQQAKGRVKPNQISTCKTGEAFEQKDSFASAGVHLQTVKVMENTKKKSSLCWSIPVKDIVLFT